MKLKEIRPKYEKIALIEDREEEKASLFPVPQIMAYGLAAERYGERKVLYMADFDDLKQTEILVESEKQFRKREKFEN